MSIPRLFFLKPLVAVLLQRSIKSNFDVQIYANTTKFVLCRKLHLLYVERRYVTRIGPLTLGFRRRQCSGRPKRAPETGSCKETDSIQQGKLYERQDSSLYHQRLDSQRNTWILQLQFRRLKIFAAEPSVTRTTHGCFHLPLPALSSICETINNTDSQIEVTVSWRQPGA